MCSKIGLVEEMYIFLSYAEMVYKSDLGIRFSSKRKKERKESLIKKYIYIEFNYIHLIYTK